MSPSGLARDVAGFRHLHQVDRGPRSIRLPAGESTVYGDLPVAAYLDFSPRPRRLTRVMRRPRSPTEDPLRHRPTCSTAHREALQGLRQRVPASHRRLGVIRKCSSSGRAHDRHRPPTVAEIGARIKSLEARHSGHSCRRQPAEVLTYATASSSVNRRPDCGAGDASPRSSQQSLSRGRAWSGSAVARQFAQGLQVPARGELGRGDGRRGGAPGSWSSRR